MDSRMLVDRYDDSGAFILGITLVVIAPVLIILGLCFKFRGQWKIASVSAVDKDSAIVARNSGPQAQGITPPATKFAPWLTRQLCRFPSTILAQLVNIADYGEELHLRNYNEGNGRELKVRLEPRAITSAGVQGEVSMDIFMKVDFTRSEGRLKVQLMVEQMDVDIKTICTRNCFERNQPCGRKCAQFFVQDMKIKLHPVSWAQACYRLQLEPHTTAEVYQVQQMKTQSVQVPIGKPQDASFTYQAGNSVSRSAAVFEWRAYRDSFSMAVTFAFLMSRFADGTKLEFKKTIWGSRPRLGIQLPHMQIHPGLQASWEVLSNAELQELQLGWDMTVTVHTAVLKGRGVIQGPDLTFHNRVHSELPEQLR